LEESFEVVAFDNPLAELPDLEESFEVIAFDNPLAELEAGFGTHDLYWVGQYTGPGVFIPLIWPFVS
jgi:hypothetical protein